MKYSAILKGKIRKKNVFKKDERANGSVGKVIATKPEHLSLIPKTLDRTVSC